MGKMNTEESSDSTKIIMSLLVNDAKISDLLRIDTLRILDLGDKRNRQELEVAAEEHLYQSAKIDDDGRCIVCLPWIQGHPP